MNGESLTPQQEKLDALKKVLPEVFAEGTIDWEKLKASLGEDINFANERYVLNWAGKSEAFKVLQTPTTKTLVPAKEESVNFDETEHIFIEGENLEVLKVLQKSYFGKVKMIYIDPPYNTGNDSFIYPDKFSETKADYQKRVGDKDEEGNKTADSFKKNSKENGQYHSNWLNMMMPRLYLAKNLLKQDGVIFVSIDDNEVHNLRLLMNEIFGEENFVASVIWEKKFAPSNDAKWLSDNHDYVLIYSKSKIDWRPYLLKRDEKALSRYKNPDNDVRGRWVSGDMTVKTYNTNYDFEIVTPSGRVVRPPDGICWRFSSEKIKELITDNRVWFGNDGGNVPRLKRFLTEVKDGVTPMTIWKHKDVGHNQEAFQEVRKLFEGQQFFSTPKPIRLINQILKIGSKNDDVIIDFFSGSGTTAHAVIALNAADGGKRKCISVQLPELCDEKSEAYKAGYKTIADIAKERIRRASKNIYDKNQGEIDRLQAEIEVLDNEIQLEDTKEKIAELTTKIEQLKNQDLGFKVLKLADSNFKQWQQITGKDKDALEAQMKLFIDPVAEHATTEKMVYELLLKSGKDLNSKIFPSFGGVAASRGGKSQVSESSVSDSSVGKNSVNENSDDESDESSVGRNSKNYFNLPYNPKLKERAKSLRQAGNLPEVLFWNQVKNKQFKGYDFDRQKIIGNYIVDFYNSNCNVVIEIDGSSHDEKVEYDAQRDSFLESLGLQVIHIPVAEVMNNMNGVMAMLYNHPALSMLYNHPELEGNHTALEGNHTHIKDNHTDLKGNHTHIKGNHPALKDNHTHIKGNHPALKGTPPEEGNLQEAFFTINDNELIFLLEQVNQNILDAILTLKPKKVIALDKLFKGNDQLKTNASLQMKDAGIEFKTI